MTQGFNGFMWAAPYVVGNAESWGYGYNCGIETFEALEAAFQDGLDTLGHDDFIIAVWANDAIIAVYGGPEKSDRRDDLFSEYGPGIMGELGVAP